MRLIAQIGLLLEGVDEGQPSGGGEVFGVAGDQLVAADDEIPAI